jgi:hypothetical protein
MNRILLLFLVSATLVFADELPTDDGFRGIWYSNQPTKDEYRLQIQRRHGDVSAAARAHRDL